MNQYNIKRGKMKNVLTALFFIIFSLLIQATFAEVEIGVGRFIVGNTPPEQPSGLEIQDGASSWDSSSLDTHDLTPNLRWTTSDNNSDIVTTTVCIATTSEKRDLNDCDAYSGLTTTDAVYNVTGLVFSGANRTYYIRLSPNDGSQVGEVLDTQFYLLNSLPNIPSGLNPTSIHNQTPILNWTATDLDDGSVNHWPADTLQYHIKAGTYYGDGSYKNNDDADKTGEIVDSAIPWGVPGEEWANNTIYVSIWTTDSSGEASEYYNTTLVVYDYLPDITNIEMTDAGSTYSSCISSTCGINPVEHSDSHVAVRVTATDTDQDCDITGSETNIHLCLNNDSCSPSISDYNLEIDSVTRLGSTCAYTFSANKTSGTPEFFRAPSSNYKLYVNVSSQAGQRISDPERTASWTYGTLKSMNYPSTIVLGDGSINLGQWNPGTTVATMSNWGNEKLDIEWSATDPTSGSYTWTLNGTDFQIDDDNSHSNESSGHIAPIYLDSSAKTFEPGDGLDVCGSVACNNANLNETLDTYFHILPPLGLPSGVYNSTITITIS